MLSLDRILDTTIAVGLDRFTVVSVAASLGVTDMAVYRYVRSRDELYSRAAARAHSQFPVAGSEPADWREFVERAGLQSWRLATAHPGIQRYILDGPYYPETLAIFEGNIVRLCAIEQRFGPHEAYLLLSRVTSLAHAATGNALAGRYQAHPDQPGELFVWTLRALVAGMAALIEAGDLPANERALSLGPEERIT